MYNKYIRYTLALASALVLTSCDTGGGFDDGQVATTPEVDPIVEDFPIVFVERPIPRNPEDEDPEMAIRENEVLDPAAFNPGARLIFKEQASALAFEAVISDAAFFDPETVDPENPPLYDVKDVSLAPDASRMVFAMRAPEDPNVGDDEQPTWNIWEYNFEDEILRRIIESDLTAEEGQDVSPAYLPNGDIVFSSTRQRRSRAILLDELKPQFSDTVDADDEVEAFLLHVVDETGTDIEQITFNQSHDLSPIVLDNGKVLFLRWDNFSSDRLSLYSVNPDGSDLTLEYGYHSQNTGTNDSEGVFAEPQELPEGGILVNLRPRETLNQGGDIVLIDAENYIDINGPTNDNIGATEPAQSSIAINPVVTDSSAPSPHGYFASAAPTLDDTGRLLVSWSPCLVEGITLGVYVDTAGFLVSENGEFVNEQGDRLADGAAPIAANPDAIRGFPCSDRTLSQSNINLADPLFSLWIYDPINETQAPIFQLEPNVMYTDALVVIQRPEQNFVPSTTFNPDDATSQLIADNVGVLNIRSIYDFDGVDASGIGIDAIADPAITDPSLRPAYFVRFFKAVSRPLEDLFEIDYRLAQGAAAAIEDFKDVLGYAPVHPDGSVKIQLPADVAFSFSILDSQGRTVINPFPRNHDNWLTLRPGEVRTCNGCHTEDSEAPHGRLDAEPPSANPGATGSVQFSNSVLLDRLGSPLPPPDAGMTMAEHFYAQKLIAVMGSEPLPSDIAALEPSIDLIFDDVWTDEAMGLTKAPSFAYRYGQPDDMGATLPGQLLTPAPVLRRDCHDDWESLCRVTISYPDHIQPLWEAPRMVDIGGVPTDVTCTNCHSTMDPDGNLQVPAPGDDRQLDLRAEFEADADMFPISYNNLFAGRLLQEECPDGTLIPQQQIVTNGGQIVFVQEQVVDADGVPQFVQEQLVIDGIPQFEAMDPEGNIVPAPLSIQSDPNSDLTLIFMDGEAVPFMTDALHVGEPIEFYNQVACEIGGATPNVQLIEEGQPIPILDFRLDENNERIPAREPTGAQADAVVSNNGARASSRFFNTFEAGGAHEGYLNGAELKLMSEWLDIGGQFYNNPFDTLEEN